MPFRQKWLFSWSSGREAGCSKPPANCPNRYRKVQNGTHRSVYIRRGGFFSSLSICLSVRSFTGFPIQTAGAMDPCFPFSDCPRVAAHSRGNMAFGIFAPKSIVQRTLLFRSVSSSAWGSVENLDAFHHWHHPLFCDVGFSEGVQQDIA